MEMILDWELRSEQAALYAKRVTDVVRRWEAMRREYLDTVVMESEEQDCFAILTAATMLNVRSAVTHCETASRQWYTEASAALAGAAITNTVDVRDQWHAVCMAVGLATPDTRRWAPTSEVAKTTAASLVRIACGFENPTAQREMGTAERRFLNEMRNVSAETVRMFLCAAHTIVKRQRDAVLPPIKAKRHRRRPVAVLDPEQDLRCQWPTVCAVVGVPRLDARHWNASTEQLAAAASKMVELATAFGAERVPTDPAETAFLTRMQRVTSHNIRGFVQIGSKQTAQFRRAAV